MEPFVWTCTHIDPHHPTHAFGSPGQIFGGLQRPILSRVLWQNVTIQYPRVASSHKGPRSRQSPDWLPPSVHLPNNKPSPPTVCDSEATSPKSSTRKEGGQPHVPSTNPRGIMIKPSSCTGIQTQPPSTDTTTLAAVCQAHPYSYTMTEVKDGSRGTSVRSCLEKAHRTLCTILPRG